MDFGARCARFKGGRRDGLQYCVLRCSVVCVFSYCVQVLWSCRGMAAKREMQSSESRGGGGIWHWHGPSSPATQAATFWGNLGGNDNVPRGCRVDRCTKDCSPGKGARWASCVAEVVDFARLVVRTGPGALPGGVPSVLFRDLQASQSSRRCCSHFRWRSTIVTVCGVRILSLLRFYLNCSGT